MSGFNTLHEYLNHYNQFRKKQAYVRGAFLDDIEFMDVISLDDHKFDVAGAYEFDEGQGKLVNKKIYSWFVVELKTMFPLAHEIKTSPFTEEDIVRLLMRVFKHGKPNWKVIMDNGLASSERVLKFLERLEVVHEVQEAYEPTQKSPNERLFGLIKYEEDVYKNDFVGSNHPVEGRHKGKELSPEATLRIIGTAKAEYDKYVTGYLIDRPRERGIKELDARLLDNTKRVSIRKLYDHYYAVHEPQKVTDVQLRYAYMKYDIVKNFQNFYITFKKEIYIPITDFSLVLNDPSYKFTLAYDPMDLNKIDMYTAQDVEDILTGELIEKDKYVCTLESLASLDANEKKKRVSVYNKKINKSIKELASMYRSKYKLDKDIANAVVGDEGMIEVRKEQTRQVESIIKNSFPIQQIESVLDRAAESNGNIDMEEALSENSINSMNEITVDD